METPVAVAPPPLPPLAPVVPVLWLPSAPVVALVSVAAPVVALVSTSLTTVSLVTGAPVGASVALVSTTAKVWFSAAGLVAASVAFAAGPVAVALPAVAFAIAGGPLTMSLPLGGTI